MPKAVIDSVWRVWEDLEVDARGPCAFLRNGLGATVWAEIADYGVVAYAAGGPAESSERFGMFELERLAEWIARALEAPIPSEERLVADVLWAGPGAAGAGKMMTAVMRLCGESLAAARPAIVELQASWFSEASRCPTELAWHPGTYHGWYARDARRFRAAVLAGAFARELAGPRVPSPEAEWLVEAVQDWKRLLVPGQGESYRSLNKTVSELPFVDPDLILGFPKRRLDRARLAPGELTVFLLTALEHEDVTADTLRVLLAADEERIVRALDAVAQNDTFSSRTRRRAVGEMLELVKPYPLPHRGTLTGLVRKAFRWRKTFQGGYERDVVGWTPERARGELEDLTYPSPPSLPEDPDVVWIDSAKEQARLAERFRNCLANRIDRATSGQSCFFSLVNGESGEAVGEVTATGAIEVQPLAGRPEDLAAAERLSAELERWRDRVRPRREVPDNCAEVLSAAEINDDEIPF